MALFPELVSLKSPRFIIVVTALIVLAILPPIAMSTGGPFYVTLSLRILIFGLAAASLNLLLGYGGLVSFGHALYLGVGAYAVAILSFHGITNGWVHLTATLALSAIISFLTGYVCLRTTGIAFIMITLAFAQMFFFLATSLKYYGGDDGLSVSRRSNFEPLFSIQDNIGLYYVTVVVLVVALYLSWRLVHSRLGRVLRGASSNARRMEALGFPVLRYRLAVYVMASCVCGVAGILLGNLTRFASPAYMAWTVSGDLIVMIILGGVATIVGPVVGAAVYVILETIVAAYTQHWMVLLGPIIVLVALFAHRGIYGSLLTWDQRRSAAR
ncbi:MAG TPA: branched-chain amino acid ABC transporter permease [Xanthobacteraceae bacterium]|jgi:branched-chain amino acid transport system permease protein